MHRLYDTFTPGSSLQDPSEELNYDIIVRDTWKGLPVRRHPIPLPTPSSTLGQSPSKSIIYPNSKLLPQMAIQNPNSTTTATKQDMPNKEQPTIEVIATLIPWADKEERLLSLFHSIAAHAHLHEPGCTRYLIYTHPSTSPSAPKNLAGGLEIQNIRLKGSKTEILERYTTQEAFDEHVRSAPFQMLVQALGEEDLLSERPGEMEDSRVTLSGGFEV
ncbi:MAG: hypothetical protein Q9166_001218 [cf. Caloplaca sp. 2 TL-2023]